jgi:putative PIN family toxin of toxin-antitoxin system
VLRVVLDPGVLVSAVLSRSGAPAGILDAWRDGEFDLIVSPWLLDELEDVLLRPRFSEYVTPEQVRAYVDGLAVEGVAFDDPGHPPRVTRDPDDDYLFALAVAAGADFLVSGDKDITSVSDPPCAVLAPRACFDRLRRARS